ncbi:MAG: IS481 family transposase [Kofleriaceae bacterium]
MPWLETSPMQQRKEFIEAAIRGDHHFAELCRRFGISRKNGYKWVNRYRFQLAFPHSEVSFKDQSRRPRTSPTAIAKTVEAAIVDLRKERPHWGPKKLRAVLLKQRPELTIPSESTFAAVLKRNGLVRPRRKRMRNTPCTNPHAHAAFPNALWAIDFKGDFVLGSGKRCYPLTITDSYSRFIIAIVALPSTGTRAVKQAMMRVFDEFGLPHAIRSDNGCPFSSRGVAGLSTLSVWWHKLGIRHERIDPGHPEQNGRHERMHRDLKLEATKPPERTLEKQQQRLDKFRARFNQERPHEALQQRTPHELYEVSSRRLIEPRLGKDFAYADSVETLRVSRHGALVTHRGYFLLSKTLADQLVGIEWYALNRARVMFGPLLLGELVAKVHRGELRFFPVKHVDLNQPLVEKGEELQETSPISSNNEPLAISAVTPVPA